MISILIKGGRLTDESLKNLEAYFKGETDTLRVEVEPNSPGEAAQSTSCWGSTERRD